MQIQSRCTEKASLVFARDTFRLGIQCNAAVSWMDFFSWVEINDRDLHVWVSV